MDNKNIAKAVVGFIPKLKRRHITGSFNVAIQTLGLLREVVRYQTAKWKSAAALMNTIRLVGKVLVEAEPRELAVGNIVRRVLYIIREEYNTKSKPTLKQLESSPSMQNLFDRVGEEDFSQPYNIKGPIIDGINQMIDELGKLYQDISEQAIEHIHANEIIMTSGKSRTVEEFLKTAARKRKFSVIVTESAPSFTGQEVAVALEKAGIETTLITDSAIFAMMARVNKVIIGTHAVMANGGLVTHTGGYVLAQAAAYHSVPLVVCTGLYKLCPQYAFDQDTFNNLASPADISSFDADVLENVDIQNPAFDYIPPELVSLFITNLYVVTCVI